MMKSVNSNTDVIETHRAKEDRRSFGSSTSIPMIDIKGKIIQKDRRHIPDRRIGNIEVKEYNYSFFEDLLKLK